MKSPEISVSAMKTVTTMMVIARTIVADIATRTIVSMEMTVRSQNPVLMEFQKLIESYKCDSSNIQVSSVHFLYLLYPKLDWVMTVKLLSLFFM